MSVVTVSWSHFVALKPSIKLPTTKLPHHLIAVPRLALKKLKQITCLLVLCSFISLFSFCMVSMEESYNKYTIAGSLDIHSPFTTVTKENSPEIYEPDVQILTSGGLRIPVHAGILASASPVLENILDRPRKHRCSLKVIPIVGVPCSAVSSFVGFLYTFRCTEEQMDKFGIHLLTLSHVYHVSPLKQRCAKGLGERLTTEHVVDVLQLARLCDAPDLYLKCMKLVASRFEAVQNTEGWKFLQNHDPWLELEILQFMDEVESRRKWTRRHKEEQSLYLQLSETMECLEHICTEGCTSVGPYDMEPTQMKGPCIKFSTCQGLQQLIRHFATCKKRVNGRCLRCKRMWQLLRLHSSICEQTDSCRVPLCRHFKLRAQQEKKGDDGRWRLLVKKVLSAKTISSLSLPKGKRMAESRGTMGNFGLTNFRL